MDTHQRTEVAELITTGTPDPHQRTKKLMLLGPTGLPLVAGAEAPLTGYTIAGAAAAVSPTDSIRTAIAKLEKRIDILEP